MTKVSRQLTTTDVCARLSFDEFKTSESSVDQTSAWWTAVFDGVTAVTDGERYPLSILYGWEFGWGIPFNMEVRERVLQSVPVRIIDIGWPGI